jgi:hypothetical protein
MLASPALAGHAGSSSRSARTLWTTSGLRRASRPRVSIAFDRQTFELLEPAKRMVCYLKQISIRSRGSRTTVAYRRQLQITRDFR